jgi:hypothetical protein
VTDEWNENGTVSTKLIYHFRYGRLGATVIFLQIILVSHGLEMGKEYA